MLASVVELVAKLGPEFSEDLHVLNGVEAFRELVAVAHALDFLILEEIFLEVVHLFRDFLDVLIVRVFFHPQLKTVLVHGAKTLLDHFTIFQDVFSTPRQKVHEP